MVEYKNRYNDIFGFELNPNGNITWSGEFTYTRFSYDDDPKVLTMIDPSGGPFLITGTNMGSIDESFNGMVIEHFIEDNNGNYEIIIKK